jgi:DMSO/TMAO reductase YedYZ molybdopterin-dependent catalytic subunit
MAPNAYLAYELEGQVLPVLHGFPLRAVFPSQNGFKWAKWIVGIRVDPNPAAGPGFEGSRER